MYEEIYPAFFTPRDKELSLSSSEEKSSEFDWLERKINNIQYNQSEKVRQSKCSVYYFLAKLYKKIYDRS